MKRRNFIKLSLFSAGSSLLMIGCQSKQNKELQADNLHYLAKDLGQKISLEGEILHVCPIKHQKMKLRLPDGEIVRVLPYQEMPFDSEQWNKKQIRVTGKLEEMRMERSTITANYNDKKLLCHIDHTPCIDAEWIENRWKDGSAQEYLDKNQEKLLGKMHKTNQNFISVFSIVAEEISLV